MIEIIPKPAKKLPIWQQILFYLSLALLGGSLVSSVILTQIVKGLGTRLGEIEEILTKEKTPEEIALEERVFDYQKKIDDFTFLVERHKHPSKFLKFFESICHPKVWFYKFNLSLKNQELVASGEAENFSVLGQQLSILQQKEEIKKAELTQVSISREGKVNFTISFSFDPKILK